MSKSKKLTRSCFLVFLELLSTMTLMKKDKSLKITKNMLNSSKIRLVAIFTTSEVLKHLMLNKRVRMKTILVLLMNQKKL